MLRLSATVVFALGLVACASGSRRATGDGSITLDSGTAEGGVRDTGTSDGGTRDGGTRDSGTRDTSVTADGGCAGAFTDCGGVCVSLTTDDANCGACGNACASGEVCTTGVCEGVCPSGAIDCAGTCVDPASDPMNCGACGEVCGAGEGCLSGVCTPSCGMGEILCGGTCTDPASDPTNCGACGVACTMGMSCVSGTCMSAPTTTTITFPASTDTRVASASLYFWRLGDYVQGTRTTTLSTLRSVSFALALDSNSLSCDTQDVRLSINGVNVGSFSIAGGTMSVMQSFTFAPITGPTYTFRLETTREVASGCGSAGYTNDVTVFTLGS